MSETNLISKFSEGEGNSKRTPRPVPKFYDDLPLFSTKKALQRRRGCREENFLLNSCPNRTAPPKSRVYSHDFSKTPAQFISCKSSRSFMGVLPMFGDLAVSKQTSHDKTYLDRSFIIQSKIGQGSFGEVFKVKSKADNKVYAVKRSIEEFRGRLDRQAKLREVEKHESLADHPNLLKFICAWEEAGLLYIQTELCYQSLASLSSRNHSISERFVWQCMIDLLEAVKYLHDHFLVHMDIKPANIFLTGQPICKLGDFGLVYDLNDPDPSPLEGDARYLAPELLHSRPTTSADMFSLGITLLEIACDLSLPIQDAPWQALRRGLLPWDIMKDKMTPNLQKIIVNLMQSDPSKRYSATQLLQHLESTEKEKLEERRIFAKPGNDSRLILSPIEPRKGIPRPFSSAPANNRKRSIFSSHSQNIGLDKWDTENEADSAILGMNDERNVSGKRPLICRSPLSSASRNHQSSISSSVLVPKSLPVTTKPFENLKLKLVFDQCGSSPKDENSY